MKKNISYSNLAIKAMQRASEVAMKEAAEKHLKIPVWEKGAISYINPNKILTKKCG